MGLMFICGFISFMGSEQRGAKGSSFTGRIISLSRSHIPPLKPVPPALPLPHPRQTIKILSATLLKNYGAPLHILFPCEGPFSLTPMMHEYIVLFSLSLPFSVSVCLSFSLPRHADAPSLLVRVSLLSILVALPHTALGSSSRVSTLRSILYSLLQTCFYPVLSFFVHLTPASCYSASFLSICMYNLSLSFLVFLPVMSYLLSSCLFSFSRSQSISILVSHLSFISYYLVSVVLPLSSSFLSSFTSNLSLASAS